LVERVDIGMDSLQVRMRVDALDAVAREMTGGGLGQAA